MIRYGRQFAPEPCQRLSGISLPDQNKNSVQEPLDEVRASADQLDLIADPKLRSDVPQLIIHCVR
jgi:hypothetical protein